MAGRRRGLDAHGRIRRILLGPAHSFRNVHRTWLYLGFLLVFLGFLVVTGLF